MQRAMHTLTHTHTHTHTHTPGKNSNYLWPRMSSSCFPAIVYSPINSLRCETGGGIDRRLLIYLHAMAESKEKANKKLNRCQISPLWLTTQTFNLNSRSDVIDCLITALQLVTTHWAHGQICRFVVLLLLKNAKPVLKSPIFLCDLKIMNVFTCFRENTKTFKSSTFPPETQEAKTAQKWWNERKR